MSIVMITIFLVVVVALSRMYLGAQYLSDVLAAALEGIAWLTLSHLAVTSWWMRKSAR